MAAPTNPAHWRTLDAPFLPPDQWRPVSGTCSRCGQPALRGVTRWWHTGTACVGRGLPANFLPERTVTR